MSNDVRILLVDDEEFYLQLYTDVLAGRRYQVRTARSGAAALALLKAERFDILVTDLLMREMDGLQLTEQVRAAFPWMDVIVVTQRDDVRLAVKSMRMGVFEYLVKPVDRDELLLTLDRLLERRRLMDVQTKLLDESMQYLQAQTIYRRCLDILSTLDFENLCEVILRHVVQALGAQGGLLWLASPEALPDALGAERLNLAGYRGLVGLHDFPATLVLQGESLQVVRAGEPFFAQAGCPLPGPWSGSTHAAGLLVPLLGDGHPLGLLLVLDKLRGDFAERDQNIAKTMAQFSAIALKNGRRFQSLERLGLRDQGTTAYNLTYFVDYAGKEIYKARRYNRAFSLVTVHIDRHEFLREQVPADVASMLGRKVAECLARVVRDSDILARVSDAEYYVLLPETDSFGVRMFVRRGQDALAAEPLVRELSARLPLHVTMGVATFPQEGKDFDELLATCRGSVERIRQGLYRRLRLSELDFWEAVEVLIGSEAEHLGPLQRAGETFRLAEDSGGASAHGQFTAPVVDALEEQVARQALAVPDSRALLYSVGGALGAETRPVERALAGAERARVFLVGLRDPAAGAGEHPLVTRVHLDDERLASHRLLLVLGERFSYACLGRHGQDGRLFAFHTCEASVVESLIARLQDHYNFQRQF
ncbi:MAG TPA: response regulator [Myxococcota bacterium]|nr:response regulator [Myxococcota bacterium]HRY94847.1 response regulator [Myxococcota bacterium]HSA22845.1 response regulator [Myxococcota bacterium]